jgi:hypothetical protein
MNLCTSGVMSVLGYTSTDIYTVLTYTLVGGDLMREGGVTSGPRGGNPGGLSVGTPGNFRDSRASEDLGTRYHFPWYKTNSKTERRAVIFRLEFRFGGYDYVGDFRC